MIGTDDRANRHRCDPIVHASLPHSRHRDVGAGRHERLCRSCPQQCQSDVNRARRVASGRGDSQHTDRTNWPTRPAHTSAEREFNVLVGVSETGIAGPGWHGKSLVIGTPGSVLIGRDPAITVHVAGAVQCHNKLRAARQDGWPSRTEVVAGRYGGRNRDRTLVLSVCIYASRGTAPAINKLGARGCIMDAAVVQTTTVEAVLGHWTAGPERRRRC
jgi:hypothetical protein